MAQPTLEPKKLLSNPKVFLSANELFIEEKNYGLAQTRGAYVENTPSQSEASASSGLKVLKNLAIILGTILLLYLLWFNSWLGILLALFVSVVLIVVSFINRGSKKYRLVLVGNSGPVAALEHQDEKKLKAVARAVNQTLTARGITPILK